MKKEECYLQILNVLGDIIVSYWEWERKRNELDLLKSNQALKESLNSIVHTLASITGIKDPYTAGHGKRVSKLAEAIARKLNLITDRCKQIKTADLLHNIGKMIIPDDILNKPNRLTDIEFKLIKLHPESGYNLLKDIKISPVIKEIILQPHERLDGTGLHPEVKGNNILQEAKIASHRPYRPALKIDTALEEIIKNRGT